MRREDLLYDIMNLAYVEGDIMGDDEQHVKHTVQDIGEKGNVDRVTRVLDRAHGECEELLFPLTRRGIDRECIDSRLVEREVYGIVLNVPDDFSQTTANLLQKLVHDYMVCSVIADWVSITNPKKAPVWQEKMESLRVAIQRKPMMSRERRRIRPSFF